MRTTNHKFGLPGLRWSKDHWDAYRGNKLLYRGPDYFEACCARLSLYSNYLESNKCYSISQISKETYLYFLVLGSKIIYIGKTATTISSRFNGHHIKYDLAIVCGVPFKYLSDLEGYFISIIKPEFNKNFPIFIIEPKDNIEFNNLIKVIKDNIHKLHSLHIEF